MRLFENKIQIYGFISCCIFILIINLSIQYRHYYNFIDEPERELIGLIQNTYKTKNGFEMIRIKSEDLIISTRISKKEKYKVGQVIKFKIYTIDINFIDFLLSNFHAKSKQRTVLNNAQSNDINNLLFTIDKIRFFLLDKIKSQHKNQIATELYSALFLAQQISKDLREKVTIYGISHLIAISGYHIVFIFAMINFILQIPYKLITQNYFPYINYKLHIAIFSFIVLFLYMLILDFVPSFLRAFIMSILGFFMYIRGIKLISFELIFVCILTTISFMPNLIFNVGFYFSCFAVFLIFICIKHFFCNLNRVKQVAILNLFLFFSMYPVVLYFFNITSIWQILSLILNIIFPLFYIASLSLHFLGFGGVFDKILAYVFTQDLSKNTQNISIYSFLLFNLLALISIKFKKVAISLPLIGALFYISSLF